MMSNETLPGSSSIRQTGRLPANLRVTLLGADGSIHVIHHTPLSVGRRDSDLNIAHSSVSSHHAVIERTSEGFVLMDHGSTNGTFVNRKQVTVKAIDNLDEIRFGEVTYTFSILEDRYGLIEGTAAPEADGVDSTILQTPAPPPGQLRETDEVMLTVEQGAGKYTVRLTRPITTVGRKDADVVVEDKLLSRRHFQIEISPEHFSVRDLGSANGTFLNDNALTFTKVGANECFTAGETRFFLHRRASAED